MGILQELFNAYVLGSFDDLSFTAMPTDELWFAIALYKDCLDSLSMTDLPFSCFDC